MTTSAKKADNSRSNLIELYRQNGFNCFPIPRRPELGLKDQKGGDSRYKAAKTEHNQVILDSDNYGVLPTEKNCIVDFDNEKYSEPLERIAEKFMVIKSPHGFHLPTINLGTDSSKIALYDRRVQEKKIIEIQGYKHYCVGAGSVLVDDGKELHYTNIGTNVIYDAEGLAFDSFVSDVCKKFKVTGRTKLPNQYYEMRQRFKEGKIPSKGTSHDYFFNAALQCNTDGLTRDESKQKIKLVYDKWEKDPTFSNRPWSDVEATIQSVYDNDKKIETGRPKGSSSGIDRTAIAQEIIASRLLYSESDIENKIIHENKNGFLEPINGTLQKQLQKEYPAMERADILEIISKLLGLAKDIPKRNKDLIVFKNGIRSISQNKFVQTDDLAYTGFKDYDYIENPNPETFIEIMFENVPESEWNRVQAALASVLKPYLDPKMSVIHGLSGVGKSTGLSIIAKLLGQYSMVTELTQLLTDRATKSNLKGKLFLVVQELPNTWKNLNQMKIMLGEQKFSGRANYGDHTEWDNTLKVFSSANYLPVIPEEEQNSMHSRRLSLIHNTKQEPYPENPTLEEEIIESEGSDILSYLFNLMQEDFKYEDRETNQTEWEKISNPEMEIISKNFNYRLNSEKGIPLFQLLKIFKEKFKIKITKDSLQKAFENSGYNVYAGLVKNCEIKKDVQSQL